jgi:diacylglycerol kinase family enzyme
MKHLFVINPTAGLAMGRVNLIIEEIRAFFSGYPEFNCEIHLTRWKRDAVGFTRRYVLQSRELVRVYASGGIGCLYEVINGVTGLPNVQIAHYPLGNTNSFLRSFGEDKTHLFNSLRNLVFAPVISLDVIKWGRNYVINSCLIGLCAIAYRDSRGLAAKTRLPLKDAFHLLENYHVFLRKTLQYYHIDLDGQNLDGEYLNLMIANAPCYGSNIFPAVDASLTDGYLDLYLIKRIPPTLALKVFADYEAGHYKWWPDYVSHYRGKRLEVSSAAMMTVTFDGELFYNNHIQFNIIKRGIDFVCPEGIDLRSIEQGETHEAS